MGTGPLGDWGPWYPAPHMPGGGGGTEAAAAPQGLMPHGQPQQQQAEAKRDPPGGNPSQGGGSGVVCIPLLSLQHIDGRRGGRGQTQISNQTCVLGSCSIDTEARRAQG